jgi:L-fucose isomerase-like protein
MKPRTFSFVTVGSPLHDAAALRRALEPYLGALAGLGGREVGRVAVAEAGPVAVVVGTGGTEAETLRLRAAREAAFPGEPLLLVTIPAHNSLPAALEALARVRQEGGRGRIAHLSAPDDGPGLERLRNAVEDLRVLGRLCRSRIGLVGVPSEWLVASVPAVEAVREVWGPETLNVDLGGVLEAPLGEPDRRALELAASFSVGAAATREPGADGVRKASTVFGALSDLMARERLDAIAVRCFDLVTGRGTSGCLALSALNDAGAVAACEGDLASAVGMLWVKELLGTASWMANPSHVDTSGGLLRLAHCTVARSLVTRWELRSHFESGLGVAIAGDLEPGPVTLLRVGGRRLDELFLAEGVAVPIPRREDLCRTQVDVRLEPAVLDGLLERPLGNHLLLVPGHHALRLRSWWEWAVARPATGVGPAAAGEAREPARL